MKQNIFIHLFYFIHLILNLSIGNVVCPFIIIIIFCSKLIHVLFTFHKYKFTSLNTGNGNLKHKALVIVYILDAVHLLTFWLSHIVFNLRTSLVKSITKVVASSNSATALRELFGEITVSH